ncbi:YdcF family protein [Leptothrix discophora]|uniref:YdcF family protein n=1 Tax=Leptothrix discophora TaxID=89 RepID=A0ABT9G0R1_LEPDI|nr:YdcF family protein [Leptothrix discophora]MDP4300080.1 YdcF family protein [Leptothrix discophora]
MLDLLADLKPVLTALILPPASPLLVGLAALAGLRRWPRACTWTLALVLALLWLSACGLGARWLQDHVLKPPAALDANARDLLQVSATSPDAVAIVVLGAGRRAQDEALDGASGLTEQGLERLRHGVWLARRMTWPIAYSGGIGWAQREGPSEAQTAARIAREDFGLPLRWTEDRSRDTRENAAATVALLRSAGVRQIVLVTHASHMPRALRAFREAAPDLPVTPAPVARVQPADRPVLDLLPSPAGARDVHNLLRELLGLWVGA